MLGTRIAAAGAARRHPQPAAAAAAGSAAGSAAAGGSSPNPQPDPLQQYPLAHPPLEDAAMLVGGAERSRMAAGDPFFPAPPFFDSNGGLPLDLPVGREAVREDRRVRRLQRGEAGGEGSGGQQQQQLSRQEEEDAKAKRGDVLLWQRAPRGREDVCKVSSGATFVLSSAKPGFGVMQLRDGNAETYWQSDGPQPHFITIHFRHRVAVDVVEIMLDAQQDESYTPRKIVLRAGSCVEDLRECRRIVLNEQRQESQGLVRIALESVDEKALLRDPHKQERMCVTVPLDKDAGRPEYWPEGMVVHLSCLQIVVVENLQNGRDTHIRHVRVFGPRSERLFPQAAEFKDESMLMFSGLR